MKLPLRKHFMGTAVALAFAATAANGANEPAEAPPSAPPPEAMQTPPAATLPEQQSQRQVSDEELRQFVAAAEDVQKIQQDFAAKAQSLQQEAEEQIVSSVEEAGMTVAEFTELVARVQNDPELAARLDDLQEP